MYGWGCGFGLAGSSNGVLQRPTIPSPASSRTPQTRALSPTPEGRVLRPDRGGILLWWSFRLRTAELLDSRDPCADAWQRSFEQKADYAILVFRDSIQPPRSSATAIQ